MGESALLVRARDTFPDLMPDEVAMIEAATAGRDCSFPDMAEIQPAILRWMCSDSSAKSLIDPRGLRIENARICGTLDLRNIAIEFLLRIHNCIVEGDIILADARLRSVGFNGTTCHMLVGDRSVVAGVVFLRRDTHGPFKSAAVSFADATVDGQLEADDAEIGPTNDESAAFIIDRARIRGYVNLQKATIKGSLHAADAQVGGIDGSGMRVAANPLNEKSGAVEIIRGTVTGWVALGIEGAIETTISGSVIMTGPVVGGGVNFTNTHIEPAPRVVQESNGMQDSTGISSHLPSSEPPAEEKTAGVLPVLVNIQLTQIGAHMLLGNMDVTDGRVIVEDTDIGKHLTCEGLFLRRGNGHLSDDHQANGAHPPESAAKSENPDPGRLWPDIAIESTRIGGTLFWKPSLPSEDPVASLSRTSAERLNIESVVFWPSRGRLALDGLQYRYIYGDTLFRRPWLAGPARRLRKSRWPSPWSLAQKPLLRLMNAVAGSDGTHLRWLRRYTRQYYDPQAYDTLASALQSMGRENDATRVLIAKADDRRRAQGIMASLLGMPYRFLVGNGFRTWWAAVWIILVTLAGTVIFNNAYQHGELARVKPASQAMPFQPFVYSLDVLLPIVNLGEADSYAPTAPQASAVRAYLWVQTGIGWVLATALAASAGAALRRRQT